MLNLMIKQKIRQYFYLVIDIITEYYRIDSISSTIIKFDSLIVKKIFLTNAYKLVLYFIFPQNNTQIQN